MILRLSVCFALAALIAAGVIGLGYALGAEPAHEPVQWIEYGAKQHANGYGGFLGDVVSHLLPKHGRAYYSRDPVTHAHETTHGINSDLRNVHGYGCGLYVGNSRGVLLHQPKCRLSHVGGLIPHGLRKSRYQLYFVQQRRDWENDPLYPLDEWVAYTNGAEAALELPDRDGSRNDSVWGALEFTIYALYTVDAAQRYDHGYDARPLIAFVGWNAERAMKLYHRGEKIKQWNWDSGAYLNYLRTSDGAAGFRQLAVKTYGQEWARKVFGFWDAPTKE